MNSTYFGLLAEFDGRAEVPLDEVAPRYFGLAPNVARRRAALHELPCPAHKLASRESPWLVSIIDLAKLIDERRAKAETEWKKMNRGSA